MRKAAYSLANLRGGINHSARDDAFHAGLLADAKGLLFLTVGKLAFIGGVRVGTGLVVARLGPDAWSSPCAVGTIGVVFGAVVGAEVSDMVTALDAAQVRPNAAGRAGRARARCSPRASDPLPLPRNHARPGSQLARFADPKVKQLSMGGEASLAFGPLGRTAAGEVRGGNDASVDTSLTYSQSRGV